MGRNSLKSFASYTDFRDRCKKEKQKSLERKESRKSKGQDLSLFL